MTPDQLRNIKKILIFTGGGIGDIVMSFPALRSLGDCFKGKKIDVAVSSRVKEVIEDILPWNEVIVWDKGLVKKTITRSLLSNYGLYFDLRKKRYDLLIDMEAIETGQAAIKRFLFYSLIHPKRIAGRDTDRRGFFLDFKAKEELLGRVHEVDRRLAIVEALGCEIHHRDISLGIHPRHAEAARAIFEGHGISERDFVVGINPNAFKPTRLWGDDKFIALAQRIHEHYGARIGIVGGQGDRPVVERIIRAVGGGVCFPVIGLNLMTFAAVLARMDMFVTNDTGPMHIAAAANTPVVAIFGPENPYRYAPYLPADRRSLVYIENVPCRPCTKYTCDEMVCLVPVTVEMVWEKFKLLGDTVEAMKNENKIEK